MMAASRTARFLALALCISIFVGSGLCGNECSAGCTCSNRIMDCRSQHISSFPQSIPDDTEMINLDDNSLTKLEQLPEEANLQRLVLSNNIISNITYDAFDNLDNLLELQLSNNSIETIADDIFEWNPLHLQVLHLDGNKMEFIQHFLFYDLEKLTELHLQNNQITFIHPHAFLQLRDLRELRLENNRLYTFNSKWVDKLQSSLTELRFEGNPWSCDCAMQDPKKWLADEKRKKWYKDLTTDHPIRCKTPLAHVGKSILDLDADALNSICDKPKITGISSSSKISAGRDVLLQCIVDKTKFPVPTLSWTAPNGDIYRLNTADNFEGISVHQNGSLLISNLATTDEGNYTCTATNKKGTFSARTSITVLDKAVGVTQATYEGDSAKPDEKHINQKTHSTKCPAKCQCVSRHIDCAGDGTTPIVAMPSDIPADAVTISFATNGLTEIRAKAFSLFVDLEELRLDSNKIGRVDEQAFSDLDKLSTLTLRENEISKIVGGTFSMLKKLKVLVLDKNHLTKLDDQIFMGLENVQWLYIRGNLIQTISDTAFAPLTSIKFIHLENNKIQVIYPATIQTLINMPDNSIQKIFVDDNPFNCDCNMDHMRTYLREDKDMMKNPDLFADGFICQTPADYVDRQLNRITKTLECSSYAKEGYPPEIQDQSSSYSGLLFGGIALGVILTIVIFILWRKYGRRARTGGRAYNYSNLNGTDDGERSALTSDGLGSSGTEAFV